MHGFPVHASLSAVSPDNPVVLTHASGHALFANEHALRLLDLVHPLVGATGHSQRNHQS